MHHGRGVAAYDRRLLELLNVPRAIALEACYLAVVLDADDQLAARGVGEGADVPCRLLGVEARALAVELEILFLFGEEIGVVPGDGLLHGRLLNMFNGRHFTAWPKGGRSPDVLPTKDPSTLEQARVDGRLAEKRVELLGRNAVHAVYDAGEPSRHRGGGVRVVATAAVVSASSPRFTAASTHSA